jgi:hypothetical protein
MPSASGIASIPLIVTSILATVVAALAGRWIASRDLARPKAQRPEIKYAIFAPAHQSPLDASKRFATDMVLASNAPAPTPAIVRSTCRSGLQR